LLRSITPILSLIVTSALLAAAARMAFDVPAGEANRTLKQFAQQAGREIIFPTLGDRTNAVEGELTVREALDQMLAGTGLVAFESKERGGIVVQRRDDPNARGAATSADRPVSDNSPGTTTRAGTASKNESVVELSPFYIQSDP